MPAKTYVYYRCANTGEDKCIWLDAEGAHCLIRELQMKFEDAPPGDIREEAPKAKKAK